MVMIMSCWPITTFSALKSSNLWKPAHFDRVFYRVFGSRPIWVSFLILLAIDVWVWKTLAPSANSFDGFCAMSFLIIMPIVFATSLAFVFKAIVPRLVFVELACGLYLATLEASLCISHYILQTKSPSGCGIGATRTAI